MGFLSSLGEFLLGKKKAKFQAPQQSKDGESICGPVNVDLSGCLYKSRYDGMTFKRTGKTGNHYNYGWVKN